MINEEELKKEKEVLESRAYRRAYQDQDFLESPACRGVRLELEFLKPDLAMALYKIESTLVIFGSARILPPSQAKKAYEEAKIHAEKYPYAEDIQEQLKKAARDVELSRYYQVARELGAIVTRESQKMDGTDRTFVVTTGGGGGIMEAGNRGASEAGGISVGLNITLPFEQRPNPYITPELTFLLNYFSIRKMHFLRRAKGLACFPGGYGTMDELFEVLTLVQTRKIKRMPILLYGREFWNKLIHWEYLEECGLISKGDLNLMTFCETAQEGWDAICKFYREEKSDN